MQGRLVRVQEGAQAGEGELRTFRIRGLTSLLIREKVPLSGRNERRDKAMEYQVGSIIEFRTFAGDLRLVRVDTKTDDIKDGRQGFSGQDVQRRAYRTETGISYRWEQINKDESWGYDYQITRVVRYENG